MIMVSSCLAGIPCRYNGTHRLSEQVARLVEEGAAVVVCPELLGGLETPREPAEIVGGSGADVLAGTAYIKTRTGEDVTDMYVAGAYRTLERARQVQADTVVLKEHSPSCGSAFIYDGTFSGTTLLGEGVTAVLLRQAGFHVQSEHEFMDWLAQQHSGSH
ncbi:DUF523 domain-containing protein [Paenibacillus sp. 481]|uniref:DUF523 domain-containing protein n=1 Tax=Paenibacillus sp. 481 TaxID=2835869 RepID=UPI001E59D6F3|nr:DUF523 domain-containing protein [Paenibacillus sp. 481]UHA74390.1 DUF523 domain-containing protein [Paenibacillus sp. 481]